MSFSDLAVVTRRRHVENVKVLWLGLVLLAMAVGGRTASANVTLTIGDKAPPLDIEHWVSDGGGQFAPVTEFAEGKVYVVEFWATWCGPCIMSQPHLATLQKTFADRGVQIISVSDESLEEVEGFLGQPRDGLSDEVREKLGIAADAEPTNGDVTAAFSLTTDPDGSTNDAYMMASGAMGIPHAFIVGKTGHIEWFGHPVEMDQPLTAVVDGTWDRDAFAKEARETQLVQGIYGEIGPMFQKGDIDGAIARLDEVREQISSEDSRLSLLMLKLQLLLAVEERHEDFASLTREILQDPMTSPDVMTEIAWFIYQAISDRGFQNAELAELARDKAIEALPDIANEYLASTIDTIAQFYALDANYDEAIRWQNKAIDASKNAREKAVLKSFVDEWTRLRDGGAPEADNVEADAVEDAPAPAID